jgi:hypothetical protein
VGNGGDFIWERRVAKNTKIKLPAKVIVWKKTNRMIFKLPPSLWTLDDRIGWVRQIDLLDYYPPSAYFDSLKFSSKIVHSFTDFIFSFTIFDLILTMGFLFQRHKILHYNSRRE